MLPHVGLTAVGQRKAQAGQAPPRIRVWSLRLALSMSKRERVRDTAQGLGVETFPKRLPQQGILVIWLTSRLMFPMGLQKGPRIYVEKSVGLADEISLSATLHALGCRRV